MIFAGSRADSIDECVANKRIPAMTVFGGLKKMKLGVLVSPNGKRQTPNATRCMAGTHPIIPSSSNTPHKTWPSRTHRPPHLILIHRRVTIEKHGHLSINISAFHHRFAFNSCPHMTALSRRHHLRAHMLVAGCTCGAKDAIAKHKLPRALQRNLCALAY